MLIQCTKKLLDGEARKPIVHLVCSKGDFAHDSGIPMKLETGVKLSDCLPSEIMYHYDFGDGWKHDIIVEKIIDDYDVNYPVCLSGEGDAPPEDVGGEPGYEQFLAIIADKEHPNYKNLNLWGIQQGYEPFDIDIVNRRMKNM